MEEVQKDSRNEARIKVSNDKKGKVNTKEDFRANKILHQNRVGDCSQIKETRWKEVRA